ncbi:protocadherin-18-like isoform X2 [Labeo rohita]|uniref:Protocadherin-18-like isoform X2 n=1 Tax=Labeo rohita TaxID=84645 RepID=A0A498MBS6_LABRO|nr:protocadherin-18-like isoform X2 [Labeo rohita]
MDTSKGTVFCATLLKLAVLVTLARHVSAKTLKYQVYEEQKVGTVIARLREDVADVLSKLPSSIPLRFRAMQRGSASLLSVRDQDGEISIRTKIDREKLCEKNLNCTIEFDVLTLPTEHLQLFHIEVEILDINDNAPQFARPVIPIEISETAAVGTRIPLDSATDPDVGENSLNTYSLTPSDFFMIDILTRTDGAKYAELVLWNHTADVPVSKYAEVGDVVTVVRAIDRDFGANGDLSCSIVGGNEAGYFSMDAKTCEIRTNVSMQDVPQDHVELTIQVQDHGSQPLSARALLRLSLYENIENHMNPHQTGGGTKDGSVDVSRIIIISLVVVCVILVLIMVAFALHCSRENKETRSYNCRVAESTYQQHPKKPSRQIHKGDITLVPTVNGTLPIRAHHRSPTSSPGPERAHMGSRQSQHSRQSLNSLVTISSNHIPENFALELTHATPPVEDMDKFSLKDSGRGDSDAGDSDCEMGRDSPIDRLLGDGFGDLFHSDGHHRLHPAVMKLCTEECRVLGHSDQCWMPSQLSSDYRANMYIPGEESRPQVLEEDQQSVDSAKKSFSTFGKDNEEECGGSLLSEMNNVFQRLLPTSYAEVNELEGCTGPPTSSIGMEIRKGFLPGKASSTGSAYPQGVAVWAANTHFQNPGGAVTGGHGSANHAASQAHLKWLPAMEEIPENYEEDDLESVLSQRQGKRNDTRHEVVDASELVAEINKLLQDVRQS